MGLSTPQETFLGNEEGCRGLQRAGLRVIGKREAKRGRGEGKGASCATSLSQWEQSAGNQARMKTQQP